MCFVYPVRRHWRNLTPSVHGCQLESVSSGDRGLCILPLSVLGPPPGSELFPWCFQPLWLLTISPPPTPQRIFFPFFNEAEDHQPRMRWEEALELWSRLEKSWVSEQGYEGQVTADFASQKLPGKTYKMPGMAAPEAAWAQTSYSLGRVQADIMS